MSEIFHSKTSFQFTTRVLNFPGYSYIDANGQLQTVSYTADAENGFRVQASNLPSRNSLVPVQDTPEVALAKKRHLDQVRKVESLPSTWQQQQPQKERSQRYPSQRSKSRHLFLLDPEEIHGIAVPRPSNAIVEPPRGFAVSTSSHHVLLPTTRVIVPMMPVIQTSMRHTQDSLGQYEYSYTGDTSAKTESRSLDGTTRGAYSYIDANGLLQQVHYIADGKMERAFKNLPSSNSQQKIGRFLLFMGDFWFSDFRAWFPRSRHQLPGRPPPQEARTPGHQFTGSLKSFLFRSSGVCVSE